jgi:hypothetical protein
MKDRRILAGATAPPVQPVPMPAPPLSPDERLRAAMKLLESIPDPDEPPPEVKPEPMPKDVPALQARALNPTLSPRERVNALSQLRSAGPDARGPDVVHAMVELLQCSGDDRIRADICRHLKGVESVRLKRQLLVSVHTDPTSKVREEAAETLGPMKDDPLVRQALEESRCGIPATGSRSRPAAP